MLLELAPLLNELSGTFSVFLSFPQRDTKISRTFKFFTAAFNFIIVAPLLKFDNSTMCRYKIMKQKVSKRPIIKAYIGIFSFT
jgi:hypothetical protein